MRFVYVFYAIGMALFYIGFSPDTIIGMGYTGEELHTGDEMLSWMTNRSVAVEMPRNGPLPVLVDLPFLVLGRVLFDKPDRGEDQLLSIEACLLTSLIATLILVWTMQVTGSLWYSLAVATAAALCTMLWPYAYIGLETKQSFFLLLAAYLALEFPQPYSWWTVCLFCVSTALALGAKSTGTFLIPAVIFLTWHFLARQRRAANTLSPRGRAVTSGRAWLCVAVPVIFFLINNFERARFWTKGSSVTFLTAWSVNNSFVKAWLVTDWVWPFLNFVGFFGSPNKGLWVFSPLCLLGCYALPVAWRHYRTVAAFTMLTLFGLAGGFSLLRDWTDETWGPRYLHSAIAPLMIVFAIVWFRVPSITARTVVAALASLGLIAAVLGGAFPYGFLSVAVNQTGQDTLEAYQGDIHLNHLRFNAKLAQIWLRPQTDASWSTGRQWFYDKPAGTPEPKTIDLHYLARPQPLIMHVWSEPKIGPIKSEWIFNWLCLAGGCFFLVVAVWNTYLLTRHPAQVL